MECPKSLLEGNQFENNRNKFSLNEGLISQNKTYYKYKTESIFKESQDDIRSDDDKYLKSIFKKNAFTNIILGIIFLKLKIQNYILFRIINLTFIFFKNFQKHLLHVIKFPFLYNKVPRNLIEEYHKNNVNISSTVLIIYFFNRFIFVCKNL